MNSQRIKPNLFIVGAAKSATSSLWQYLRQHPRVFMPSDALYKEPAYFSLKGCSRGYEGYLDIFAAADESHKWIGEASTAYLTDPISAKLIYEFDPKSKIIILLRNPADRAYSLYNWMVQDGYEYAESFEQALRLETERLNKKIPNWYEPEYYWNYLYFHSGQYYNQVKRYLDLFGDNLLVVKVDDFRRAFSAEYKRICSFLDLKPNRIPPRTYNKSRRVYSAKSQFVLRKITTDLHKRNFVSRKYSKLQVLKLLTKQFISNSVTLYRGTATSIPMFGSLLVFMRMFTFTARNDIDLHCVVTKSQRDALLLIGLRNTEPKSMTYDTRRNLLSKYRNNIQQLQSLLNMDFSEWLF